MLKEHIDRAASAHAWQAVNHYAKNRSAYRENPEAMERVWNVRKITGLSFDEIDQLLESV